MMILRSTPPSPYARKVHIAIALVGLTGEVEVQPTDLNDESDTIRAQNPLGKVPALIVEDGTVYYDSRVILEYLDQRAGGGRIVPREPAARFAALRLQALADGILDASLLQVYEQRYRPPERREPSWVERQAEKVRRGLAMLEAAPPQISAIPDVGQIALACALGYGDLRFDGAWRKGHPRLVAWLDDFASRVPSYAETRVAA